MRKRHLSVFAGALIAMLITIGLGPATSAHAAVSQTPARLTPSIGAKSTIYRLAHCGNTIYAVGKFSRVNTINGGHVRRANAFSFNEKTGSISRWYPIVDGPVYAIALSNNCALAYLGGTFKHVGGVAAHNIAAVSTRTSKVYRPFAHSANATVHSISVVNHGRQVIAGGYFTKINGSRQRYLASLSPVIGSPTRYLQARVSGRIHNATSGYTMVWNQEVSPSGRKLLIEGDFTRVGGWYHNQVAVLSLSAHSARVTSWTNRRLNAGQCKIAYYMRGGAWSPDERTIYLAATGAGGSSPFCDAVSAFTYSSPARVKWVNETGRDSLYTVAAARDAVYIGGHERWADNPYGRDTCGRGCVSRPGVGAINPRTGKATSWNPTRSRGKGAFDMMITSEGCGWLRTRTSMPPNAVTSTTRGCACSRDVPDVRVSAAPVDG